MSIHEFRCGKCRKTFEMIVQGDPAPVCPACHSTELERCSGTSSRAAMLYGSSVSGSARHFVRHGQHRI